MTHDMGGLCPSVDYDNLMMMMKGFTYQMWWCSSDIFPVRTTKTYMLLNKNSLPIFNIHIHVHNPFSGFGIALAGRLAQLEK